MASQCLTIAIIAQRVSALEEVTSATGSTYDGALLIGPKGSTYAVLRGVEGNSQQAKSDLENSVVAGSATTLFDLSESNVPNVLLGSELAARAGLEGWRSSGDCGDRTRDPRWRRSASLAFPESRAPGSSNTIQPGYTCP